MGWAPGRGARGRGEGRGREGQGRQGGARRGTRPGLTSALRLQLVEQVPPSQVLEEVVVPVVHGAQVPGHGVGAWGPKGGVRRGPAAAPLLRPPTSPRPGVGVCLRTPPLPAQTDVCAPIQESQKPGVSF